MVTSDSVPLSCGVGHCAVVVHGAGRRIRLQRTESDGQMDGDCGGAGGWEGGGEEGGKKEGQEGDGARWSLVRLRLEWSDATGTVATVPFGFLLFRPVRLKRRETRIVNK